MAAEKKPDAEKGGGEDAQSGRKSVDPIDQVKSVDEDDENKSGQQHTRDDGDRLDPQEPVEAGEAKVPQKDQYSCDKYLGSQLFYRAEGEDIVFESDEEHDHDPTNDKGEAGQDVPVAGKGQSKYKANKDGDATEGWRMVDGGRPAVGYCEQLQLPRNIDDCRNDPGRRNEGNQQTGKYIKQFTHTVNN